MSLFSEYSNVMKLLKKKQQVVFYAESRYYYQYFEKLIDDLVKSNIEICYITSDQKDTLLVTAQKGMQVIYVKWMLGFLFSKLKADVMIMTMPDIGNFLFKKSSAVGTYVYLFHAAVSTHQQYRKQAFFNYDSIFCCGGYHEREIRKAEDIYNLPAKELLSYGYPLFDTIKQHYKPIPGNEHRKKTILIAPSWFDGCIFDTCINELLQQLSSLPYKVVLRSHPEFKKRKRKNYNKVLQLIKSHPEIEMDDASNVLSSLATADILITDRSGIALEFAFGIRKPVLFIDTALKINNDDYEKLNIEPLENWIRSTIGISILPGEFDRLNGKLIELKNMLPGFEEKMEKLSSSIFYNNETAYKSGLQYIIQKLSN